MQTNNKQIKHKENIKRQVIKNENNKHKSW